MCDTSSILSDTFGKLNLPGVETAKSFEGFVGKATPIISAGADAFSAITTSNAAAKQQGKRMAQITFGADMNKKQMEQIQDRRLGANKAAFAKSGIKQTGSAKRLIEEQIRNDEVELLKITHEKNVGLIEARKNIRQAELESRSKIAGAFGSKEVYSSAASLFGLGN